MRKTNGGNYPSPDISEMNDVVSSTDCTGLIQGLPLEEDEVEAYGDIYDIPDQAGLELPEE